MLKDEQVEILTSIKDYTANVIDMMPYVVNAYRMADIAKISEYSLPLIEGFEWLNEAITLTNQFHDISMSEIKEVFEELMDSMQYKDYVLTADLFEFEILPKFKEWNKKISDLLEIN
ncbi:hypothetical protein HMPREF9630_01928 [Peptoanaerobacter stomatis]|uniref:DUF8042 domain-containing protein n=1 Tax=Peptoanaerobacter stomatis TaxID=796937 RepID=V9HPS9_9FIRM|nr:hypothetical protein [Peptoanaerobacter stomatis]EHL16210.1 hypothetical protein HMPREF9630_01928 [Peptoanaerobacter stomatis]